MTDDQRLIAGLQPVREAIRVHGRRLSRVVVDGRSLPRLDALERFARDQQVPVVERRPKAELDRIAGGTMHQGVLAWGPPLGLTAPESLLDDPTLAAIALDGIQDPQNFGAVIRSAVGVASAAVVFGEHSAAPLTPATFRASAGAVEHARLCRPRSLSGFLRDAAAHGVTVVGLDAQATVSLSDVDLSGPTVVVVGNEHSGIGRGVRRACTVLARLIETERIDSLNASVAAAIALYELKKQRVKSAS
ncbi:MAG: RNA methyltransferase [Myxococcales bacterium]|nr:RNA methyltransferase [Myxococcales bacterium]MCB9580540.1 RNA methyltransferase [Polyangiaceae bacterium]